MPLDAQGNYVAVLPDDPIGNIGIDGAIMHGSGAPDANTPISSGYINDDNGDFYVNTTGDSSGWILAASPSGGANPAVIYTSNPNTESLKPADQTKPCVAYSRSGDGSFFGWDTVSKTWK